MSSVLRSKCAAPALHVVEHAVLAEQNAFHVLGHGQTGHAGIDLRSQIRNGRGGGSAKFNETLYGGRIDVVDHYIAAALDQVGADASAHFAESDKTEFHVFLRWIQGIFPCLSYCVQTETVLAVFGHEQPVDGDIVLASVAPFRGFAVTVSRGREKRHV